MLIRNCNIKSREPKHYRVYHLSSAKTTSLIFKINTKFCLRWFTTIGQPLTYLYIMMQGVGFICLCLEPFLKITALVLRVHFKH